MYIKLESYDSVQTNNKIFFDNGRETSLEKIMIYKHKDEDKDERGTYILNLENMNLSDNDIEHILDSYNNYKYSKKNLYTDDSETKFNSNTIILAKNNNLTKIPSNLIIRYETTVDLSNNKITSTRSLNKFNEDPGCIKLILTGNPLRYSWIYNTFQIDYVYERRHNFTVKKSSRYYIDDMPDIYLSTDNSNIGHRLTKREIRDYHPNYPVKLSEDQLFIKYEKLYFKNKIQYADDDSFNGYVAGYGEDYEKECLKYEKTYNSTKNCYIDA